MAPCLDFIRHPDSFRCTGRDTCPLSGLARGAHHCVRSRTPWRESRQVAEASNWFWTKYEAHCTQTTMAQVTWLLFIWRTILNMRPGIHWHFFTDTRIPIQRDQQHPHRWRPETEEVPAGFYRRELILSRTTHHMSNIQWESTLSNRELGTAPWQRTDQNMRHKRRQSLKDSGEKIRFAPMGNAKQGLIDSTLNQLILNWSS